MKDIKNMNIWKTKETVDCSEDLYLDTDIEQLNLSVRPFNCLKRAKCQTIRDIVEFMGEDGQGLRKIRNLGTRSEEEIMEKLEIYREICRVEGKGKEKKKVTLIKPEKKIWDREIDEFHLSNYALTRLKACGIRQIRDLYATNPKQEPGWYAVRELFEKIPGSRTS